jgi:hypothetical protein
MKFTYISAMILSVSLLPSWGSAQEPVSSEGELDEARDAQSGAVFTLAAGLNIPFGDSISGSTKPGPSVAGDLVGVVEISSRFKLGFGGLSDYTLLLAESGAESGMAGFYSLSVLFKPLIKIRRNIYSVFEVGAGYVLAHSIGDFSSYTRNMFGVVAGTGLSLSRFVFGAKYRIALDGVFQQNWVTVYIGVVL